MSSKNEEMFPDLDDDEEDDEDFKLEESTPSKKSKKKSPKKKGKSTKRTPKKAKEKATVDADVEEVEISDEDGLDDDEYDPSLIALELPPEEIERRKREEATPVDDEEEEEEFMPKEDDLSDKEADQSELENLEHEGMDEIAQLYRDLKQDPKMHYSVGGSGSASSSSAGSDFNYSYGGSSSSASGSSSNASGSGSSMASSASSSASGSSDVNNVEIETPVEKKRAFSQVEGVTEEVVAPSSKKQRTTDVDKFFEEMHQESLQAANQSFDYTQSQTEMSKTVKTGSSRLSEALNKMQGKKESTLKVSKQDWGQFKKTQGVEDELKQYTKDGFLEKQAFLERTQMREFEQAKELRNKERDRQYNPK